MPTYRLHDHAGDDLAASSSTLLSNPKPGDVIVFSVTARVEAEPGPLTGAP